MTSERKLDGGELTVVLHGQIDSMTSSAFEQAIGDVTDIHRLVLDFADVDYISSVGLRVLMRVKRELGDRTFMLINLTTEVRDVLDITGSSRILGL